ncbi:hypothetical protein ACI8B_210144 [Acinetobacter proteolyticus]|uniref:Uncharacterized protein n=1 Tax=Acinetobacter proteolyticus TaxID=1776741 RepID=A0A653K3F1_9GAMM|nr:hypothetical protein ACI8B_210144 [Acinetobacter proteolyticus]
MKIIYFFPLAIVAVCMLFVSRQYSINIGLIYGFWMSGFLFGMGFHEASEKLKARTKNSNN